MKMHPVKSSKIDVIGYDEKTHKLRVSLEKKSPVIFATYPRTLLSHS